MRRKALGEVGLDESNKWSAWTPKALLAHLCGPTKDLKIVAGLHSKESVLKLDQCGAVYCSSRLKVLCECEWWSG